MPHVSPKSNISTKQKPKIQQQGNVETNFQTSCVPESALEFDPSKEGVISSAKEEKAGNGIGRFS
jgi:hypothetical protein